LRFLCAVCLENSQIPPLCGGFLFLGKAEKRGGQNGGGGGGGRAVEWAGALW